MPSVCIGDCGLRAVDGVLELDWAQVGAGYGVAQSAAISVPVDTANPDYVGPYGTQRLTYANNTCRPQLVEYEAYIPYVSIDMGDDNWWNVALFWTHAINAAPANSSFNISSIALLRANYPFGEPLQHVVTAPIPGRHVLVVVQPGETLHMMASLWKRLLAVTAAPGNRIYAEHIALQYRRWPLA